MKILILCKKFPYPLTEGEPIAISYLSRALVDIGCEVTLMVLNTSKHFFDPAMLPPESNHFSEIHSVRTYNHITWKGAALALVRGESYILSRFYSRDFAAKLRDLLQGEQFDAVQLETIYMAHYIPVVRQNSRALVSIRAHNVEHKIWERVAARSGIFKKWYLRHEQGFLKKFEIEKTKECDLLVAITEADSEHFRAMGYRGPAISVPVGLDTKRYATDFRPGQEKHSIAFIGALDWMPNQDGIVWFLENVWPVVSGHFPEMELHIAGKNTPDWMFRNAGERVFVHGEVPDAQAFISGHPVLVAPLFSGSGIKVKVLEGMALGRAVVTTDVGAEGIEARTGEHLLVANTAEAFAEAVIQCFSQHEKTRNMRRNAAELIRAAFDPIQLAERLKGAYAKLISQKPR